jgi:glycosyltransferase involved in cell wall biosynthesis
MPTWTWAIITGEYPPAPGGVSDYTYLLAQRLADAGDDVHVWAPDHAGEGPNAPGVRVHRLTGCFGPRAIRQLDLQIGQLPHSTRILVQYVPHAFGYKAMNVPFCLWLWMQRRRPVWVMFHEVSVFFKRSQPMRHNAIALVNRVMAWLVTHAAERLFISIPGWKPLLDPLMRATSKLECSPIPSNLPTQADPQLVRRLRAKITGPSEAMVIGHFGTFGGVTVPALNVMLPRLLSKPGRICVLIGRGGREFTIALLRDHPELKGRLVPTGGLAPEEVAAQLAGCDLIIQPYPDGACGRRGSLMASLALGLPIVTNSGHLTEPLWAERSAVALAPDCDEAFIALAEKLLGDATARATLGQNARSTYHDYFDIQRTVEKLRG